MSNLNINIGGQFKVQDPESNMQKVTVRIQRALQGEQQGQFYGSPVRQPGSKDSYRMYNEEVIISVPANFEPIKDSEGKPIPQLVSFTTGEGIVERDVTNQTASLALTQSQWEALQELPGQAWLITLMARVNVNALKGHGRQGTFWVENLQADYHLVEAEGPIAAASVADLDAALDRGKQFSQDNLRKAFGRREERATMRPANLETTATRAEQMRQLSKKAGDPSMRDKAVRNAGLAADRIPTSPHRTFVAATNQGATQTEVQGGSGNPAERQEIQGPTADQLLDQQTRQEDEEQ